MDVSSQEMQDVFDTTDFPQWAKDLRRWDVITFGLFPFCVFFVNVTTDMIRWNNANGMDFNDRYYAPWPLKPAGAYEKTPDEYFRTIMIAASLSASIALVDLIIVKSRQSKQRRILESRPAGTYTIERRPITEFDEPADSPGVTDEAAAPADESGAGGE